MITIIAVGNESRGDDAIGPILLRRLEALALPDVRLVLDYQLQIEHACELDGADAVFFIDAGIHTPAPYTFETIQPAAPRGFTHALLPQELLTIYRDAFHKVAPPAYVLCVAGKQFGLGEAVSDAAKENMEQAWAHLAGQLSPCDA